jgi:hypothetical protein
MKATASWNSSKSLLQPFSNYNNKITRDNWRTKEKILTLVNISNEFLPAGNDLVSRAQVANMFQVTTDGRILHRKQQFNFENLRSFVTQLAMVCCALTYWNRSHAATWTRHTCLAPGGHAFRGSALLNFVADLLRHCIVRTQRHAFVSQNCSARRRQQSFCYALMLIVSTGAVMLG